MSVCRSPSCTCNYNVNAFAADSMMYCFVCQRDGADYAVYVNTAQEFDGCDSGASPDEAVSWGKIKAEAKPVKVFDIRFYIIMSWLSSTY